MDYDARLAGIVDDLPGYGGHYTEDGHLVVWLKANSSDLTRARAAIGDFRYRSLSGNEAASQRRRAAVDAMTVRVADYDFRELYGWYGELRRPVWALGSINWTDIDERTNRIEIGVTDQSLTQDVERIVDGLSIPRGAVVVVHDPQVLTPQSDTLSTEVPFRRAGVQVSIDASSNECTMAFSTDRPQDGYWYFVTASHCTSTWGDLDGETIGQPYVGTAIGYEVSDPDYWTNATDTLCTATWKCRKSDVALFRYTTWNFFHGYVAWPSLGDSVFTTSVPIVTSYDPEVGDTVHMVGRTSGRQSGEVLNTCQDKTSIAGWRILCAWTADYDSDGGDSGAPVVWVDPADETFKVAAGVHSGGNSSLAVFSATSQWKYEIEQDYGGTYCEASWCGPDPRASISGPSIVPNTWQQCSWGASATRGIPPYTFSWSGVASGTGSNLFASVSGAGWLTVEVTDAIDNTDTASLYITIDSEAEPEECQL